MDDRPAPRRPEGVDDDLVAAVGKASEAFEWVERARGHLYSFHQLMGHADAEFAEAAEMLEDCGATRSASVLSDDVVGRNVLDGRWTFQVVEEFDDLYYDPVRSRVRALDDEHMGGERHVFESELKERNRTHGQAAHAARPPDGHTPAVDTG